MAVRTLTIMLVLVGLLAITACANFSKLENDLSEWRANIVEIKGSISAPGYEDDPVVIVHMQSMAGKVVDGYDFLWFGP